MQVSFQAGRPELEDWIRVASSLWSRSSASAWMLRCNEEREMRGLDHRKYTTSLWCKMVCVFDEVLKRRSHKQLMACKDIAWLGDGKSKAEALLFTAVDWHSLDEVVGCFGVFNPYDGMDLTDLTEKTATTRMLTGLERCIDNFCSVGYVDEARMRHQPGVLREEVRKHVLSHSTATWWDGDFTIQKVGRLACGELLKESNPFSGRDLMHEIDGIVDKCLSRVPECASLLAAWIDGPTSHAKQVTYSDVYKARFIEAQKLDIQNGRIELDKPLENLSYSGTRKLSKADTVRGIVFTAVASAFTVDWQSTKSKKKEVREASAKALALWDPEGATRFAMIGDLLLTAKLFKEFSDKTAMDPAVAPRKNREFKDKIFGLYTKAEILGPAGEDTLTQRMLRTLQKSHVFFTNGRAFSLGIPFGEIDFAKAALKSLQRVVELMSACLDATFDETSFEATVEAFDVRQWGKVFSGMKSRVAAERERWQKEDSRLMGLHARLCQCKNWMERAQSFKLMAQTAVDEYKKVKGASDDTIGKTCWKSACLRLLKDGGALFSDVERRKISFYLGAFQRKTTVNERFLKTVAEIWGIRGKRTSMASVSHAANFKHFGPRALPDFAVSVDGRLVPQDFAIDCDAIWGELFSNRVFRVKKLRKKKRQVSSKTKTHFHKQFRAAIRMIRRHANQKGRGGYRSIVNGASVKTMRPGIAGVSQWSDAQRKMVGKHCQLKKMRDDIQRRRVSGVANPHVKEAQAEKKRLATEERNKQLKKRTKSDLKASERNVWMPNSLRRRDVVIPDRWREVSHATDAHVILTIDINRLSQPKALKCDVTGKTFQCLAAEVCAAMLLGCRLAPVAYLSDPATQTVKFRPRWRQEFNGFYISDAFTRQMSGFSALLTDVLVGRQPDSKFTALSEMDFARWQKDKKLKLHCYNIRHLGDFNDMVVRVAQVDVSESDTLYV